MPRRPNAGLLLEEIKQEAADYSDIDGFDGSKLFGSAKRRTSLDGGSAPDAGFLSGRKPLRSSMNPVKMEGDMLQQGETTFTVFASLLDSAIQGQCSNVIWLVTSLLSIMLFAS
jgi:nuclear pore complex protein Nup107